MALHRNSWGLMKVLCTLNFYVICPSECFEVVRHCFEFIRENEIAIKITSPRVKPLVQHDGTRLGASRNFCMSAATI